MKSTSINGFDVAVIAANMLHDARNGKSAEIGGGVFAPEELRQAAQILRAAPELLAALQAMLNYANLGAYERADAVKAARAAIAKAGGAL